MGQALTTLFNSNSNQKEIPDGPQNIEPLLPEPEPSESRNRRVVYSVMLKHFCIFLAEKGYSLKTLAKMIGGQCKPSSIRTWAKDYRTNIPHIVVLVQDYYQQTPEMNDVHKGLAELRKPKNNQNIGKIVQMHESVSEFIKNFGKEKKMSLRINMITIRTMVSDSSVHLQQRRDRLEKFREFLAMLERNYGNENIVGKAHRIYFTENYQTLFRIYYTSKFSNFYLNYQLE